MSTKHATRSGKDARATRRDLEFRVYTAGELLEFHPSFSEALADAAGVSLAQREPTYVGLIARSRATAVKAMGRKGGELWDLQFGPRPKELDFLNTWRVDVKELGPE